MNLDKDKLSALKAGKLSAFNEMLSVFEKPIFNYVYRLVGQKQDAEDLTQEVFIKVFKNRATIDIEKNFKSWLFKIATNSVFDHFRSAKNKHEFSFDAETLAGLPETIDHQPSYYLIEKDVDRALKAIKPAYKTVIMLFYFHGFGYEEISSILSLPLNTVKTNIHRAKQELKNQLNKSLI